MYHAHTTLAPFGRSPLTEDGQAYFFQPDDYPAVANGLDVDAQTHVPRCSLTFVPVLPDGTPQTQLGAGSGFARPIPKYRGLRVAANKAGMWASTCGFANASCDSMMTGTSVRLPVSYSVPDSACVCVSIFTRSTWTMARLATIGCNSRAMASLPHSRVFTTIKGWSLFAPGCDLDLVIAVTSIQHWACSAPTRSSGSPCLSFKCVIRCERAKDRPVELTPVSRFPSRQMVIVPLFLLNSADPMPKHEVPGDKDDADNPLAQHQRKKGSKHKRGASGASLHGDDGAGDEEAKEQRDCTSRLPLCCRPCCRRVLDATDPDIEEARRQKRQLETVSEFTDCFAAALNSCDSQDERARANALSARRLAFLAQTARKSFFGLGYALLVLIVGSQWLGIPNRFVDDISLFSECAQSSS